jgi:hypothetical protein
MRCELLYDSVKTLAEVNGLSDRKTLLFFGMHSTIDLDDFPLSPPRVPVAGLLVTGISPNTNTQKSEDEDEKNFWDADRRSEVEKETSKTPNPSYLHSLIISHTLSR